MKKQVAVEYIQDLLNKLTEFDSLNLSEIELTENGQPIEISDMLLSEWRFFGLTNSWFVEDRFWETNLEELQKEMYEETPDISRERFNNDCSKDKDFKPIC